MLQHVAATMQPNMIPLKTLLRTTINPLKQWPQNHEVVQIPPWKQKHPTPFFFLHWAGKKGRFQRGQFHQWTHTGISWVNLICYRNKTGQLCAVGHQKRLKGAEPVVTLVQRKGAKRHLCVMHCHPFLQRYVPSQGLWNEQSPHNESIGLRHSTEGGAPSLTLQTLKIWNEEK